MTENVVYLHGPPPSGGGGGREKRVLVEGLDRLLSLKQIKGRT
jgi:hypothetical protein